VVYGWGQRPFRVDDLRPNKSLSVCGVWVVKRSRVVGVLWVGLVACVWVYSCVRYSL
jgi:hypothetical protein